MIKLLRTYTLVALALIGIAGLYTCTFDGGNNNFDNNVSIPDPNDKNMPMITELGENTAGAYIAVTDNDTRTWTINYNPNNGNNGGGQNAQIKQDKDSLKIMLNGVMNPYYEPLTITFTLPNIKIDSLTGLQALSNQSFSMANKTLKVKVPGFSQTFFNSPKISEGTLQLKRCRRIYINDNNFRGVNVSGTFEIKGVAADTLMVDIASGRFDMLFSMHDQNGNFF